MEVNTKSSRAGSILTKELSPDAYAHPEEERAGVRGTEQGKEEEDPLSSPKLHGLLTGAGGMEVNTKSSRAGSILTKEVSPDAQAHPKERAGTCNNQQNLLADFKVEKLTGKDIGHLPRGYDISHTKEQSEPKTNPLGNGGNTT